MQTIFDELNPEQYKAVTHLNGPLLIIAGAGTGKTKVLTHRFIHLINQAAPSKKNSVAEKILALTFTEKAALEMQERIDVLLPYGYPELWIKTFHGFSDHILRESGLAIGLDTAYKILTPIELNIFLREHLFAFELNRYRPLGNPSRFISALVTHFGHLRDELISPNQYYQYAQKSLKNAITEEEKEIADSLMELAKAYLRYDQLLYQKGVMDFASLNFLTIKLFQENSAILHSYQNRFTYLMVDEFRDTNTAQRVLIEKIAEPHHNIMVVGDDDQCIYKWRGASLSNILHFEQRFINCKRVVLTQNYRSTQPILDLSYAVIQNNNPNRLEIKDQIDKRLHSTTINQNELLPLIIHFDHYLKEAQFVIDTIKNELTKGTLNPKDFAILVRASAHAIPFIDALKTNDIAYDFSGNEGLFKREEIKDLMALLRSIVNPNDDIALFRLLSLDVFNEEISNLLESRHQGKNRSSSLFSIIKQLNTVPDLFTPPSSKINLQKALSSLKEFQKMAQKSPTSQILGKFLNESGYLNQLTSNPSIKNTEKIQNIALFSQIIKTFEETHLDQQISECLDYLNARFEIGDNAPSLEAPLDNDTVKVLTIHAAKGLEFNTVFIVNLVQNRFPAINRKEIFEIPTELLTPNLNEDQTHFTEERRLFYVAATRAKKQLFLTYSDQYEGPKRWKPSCFIQEALKSDQVKKEEFNPSTQPPIPQITLTTSLNHSLKEPKNPTNYPLLNLSYSQIDTFQICPLKYKFAYHYHLPGPSFHAASFGSSIHNTLNEFYKQLIKGIQPSLKLLQHLYHKNWIPFGYENPAHQNEQKIQGLKMIEQFFQTNDPGWIIPRYLEKSFCWKSTSGLTIKGRIDRIDPLTDGNFEVIDYKTGKSQDEKTLKNNLQLSIYALACRDVLKIPVTKLTLYYLAENKKISTSRTPEQLIDAEQNVETITNTIKNSSFEATPSPFICQFCEYRLICDKSAV